MPMKKILVLLAIVAGLAGCSSDDSAPAPASDATEPPPPVPVIEESATDEIEPNNDTVQANPVILVDNAIIIKGSVDSDFFGSGSYDDKDYFSFALNSEATLTLTLVSANPVENDIDLRVRDESGIAIVSDTSRGGLPLISNLTLAAGVIWYIEVDAYLTDTVTPYTLTIAPSQ